MCLFLCKSKRDFQQKTMKNFITANLNKKKLIKGPFTLDRTGASIPIVDPLGPIPYHVMNRRERNRLSAANSRENRILRFEDLEIETTYHAIIKDILDDEFEAIQIQNAAAREDIVRMETLRNELKIQIQLMNLKK